MTINKITEVAAPAPKSHLINEFLKIFVQDADNRVMVLWKSLESLDCLPNNCRQPYMIQDELRDGRGF